MAEKMYAQEKSTLETIQKMYAAFDKNDLDTVLALQAEDVVWHVGQGDEGTQTSPDPCLPYAGTFKGREGLKVFFRILGETTRFRGYDRTQIVVQGDTAMVVIHDRATALNTGHDYDTWLIHKVQVQDGQVKYLWNHIDTGPIMAARQQTAVK